METIEILQRYRDNSTNSSFDLTLRVIEDVLNQRLSPDYRRIRVQGSNSGLVRFCFTIFLTRDSYNERGRFWYGYVLRSQDMKNIRNWRPDGEMGSEIANIENIVESFRRGCLSDILS
jgi:hypothetical protein